MPGFKTIARFEDVPDGRAITVHLNGRDFAVFRTGEACSVLDAHCPHKGGPLALGWIEHGKVYCPLHGWDFEIATGRCGTRPDKPVECFETRIVNGEIQINLP